MGSGARVVWSLVVSIPMCIGLAGCCVVGDRAGAFEKRGLQERDVSYPKPHPKKEVRRDLPPKKEAKQKRDKPVKLARLDKVAPVKKAKQVKQPPQMLTLLRTVKDVSLPQSIVYDPKKLQFYVSRLGSKPGDNTGQIALLSRDGSLVAPDWIQGLDQPRGLALLGDYLYVADGKALVEIDIANSKISNRFVIDDVFYFYDVVANSQGQLFVSAPLNNAIYVLEKGQSLKLWVQSSQLSGPNGLAIENDDLYVGSIGLETTDKASASANEKKGGLYKVSLSDKAIKPFTAYRLPPIASLASDEQGFVYASDEDGASLFQFDLSDGSFVEEINVARTFGLKQTTGLGDFAYLTGSKEFWVPVKSNGHILVFGRSDEKIITQDEP